MKNATSNPMLLLTLTGALASSAMAELVSRGEHTGVGARALSMGEAFTGVADDYSALYYNAAGMTQLRRSELGLNLDYRLRTNSTSLAQGGGAQRSAEATRINALSMVLTQGCGWAFGMGYYSPTAFDDPLQYFAQGREYAYEALGSMHHFRVAFAFAPSTRASLGIAVSALGGSEQLEIRDGNRVRYLEEYAGFNLEPSFLIHFSDELSLGGSAVAVERLALRDTYQEEGSRSIETHYSIRNPFQTRLGLAFQQGLTLVSLDWHGTFWSSYAYAEEGGAFFTNDGGYPNAHVFALGLEQYLTRKGPVIRAGVSVETDDKTSFDRPQIDSPKGFYFGLGLPASKHLLLDLGYQYNGGTLMQRSTANGPTDLTIAQSGQQVMGSLRFRW